MYISYHYITRKQPKHNFEKRYGVITILDVLGTKGSWKDKEKMQRLTNWSHLLDELDNFLYKRGNKILKVQLAVVSDTIFLLCSIKTTNEELPLHLVKHPINLIPSVISLFFPKFMNNGIYKRFNGYWSIL